MIHKLINLLGSVPQQTQTKDKQELIYNGLMMCITFLVSGLEYGEVEVTNHEILVRSLNAVVCIFEKEGKVFLEGIYNIMAIVRIMHENFKPHCDRLWDALFKPLLGIETCGNFEETQASLDLMATLAQTNCLSEDQYQVVLAKTLHTVRDGNVSTENKPGLFITLGTLS